MKMNNTVQNTRQLKVARQIQRDLSEIFQLQGMAMYDGAMITVVNVRISPDLAVAHVWVSIFPSAKATEILNKIQEQSRSIRGNVGRRVAKQLRIVPELIFSIDDSLDYAEHIDELLKN